MLTPSSIASSTTHTGSISPATACDALVPTKHPRIDQPATECQKLSASEAPDPGRHHVGILGDIIPESPGGFVGIRSRRASREIWCEGRLIFDTMPSRPSLQACANTSGPSSWSGCPWKCRPGAACASSWLGCPYASERAFGDSALDY